MSFSLVEHFFPSWLLLLFMSFETFSLDNYLVLCFLKLYTVIPSIGFYVFLEVFLKFKPNF